MKRRDLLLEIGCEELPAQYVRPALKDLQDQGLRLLKEARLIHGESTVYGTPRRLTVFIKDLEEKQLDLEEEVKGPPAKVAFHNGQYTTQALGFAKAHGAMEKDLFIGKTQKGDYLFLKKKHTGHPTLKLLPKILPAMIRRISFPKAMRWGLEEVPFGRPIRWITPLYGQEVVDFEFSGIRGGNKSWGLRFFYPQPVLIKEPALYLETLLMVGVVADHRERKEMIERQLKEISIEYHTRDSFDEGLVEENTFLVEYPTAFVGQFDSTYLELPKDVLKNAMQEHQRYFPLEGEDGLLRPYFVGIRNGGKESLGGIIQGNEQVIEARLSDARFFFHEDQKVNLEERGEELKKVLFHESLGTLHHKLERMSYLATDLSRQLGFSREKEEEIKRAVRLCKADLTTEMVKEFPKLQGIIGKEYAHLMGEGEEVALAIGEHYKPRFSGDELPKTDPGLVLSLVDKLDSIVAFFSQGLLPKSSQDPYALRRQGQGIIRMIVERDLDFSIKEYVRTNLKLLQGQGFLKGPKDHREVDILSFFVKRLELFLLSKGFDYDLTGSLLQGEVDIINRTYQKALALQKYRHQGNLTPLVVALTRAFRLSQELEGGGELQEHLFLEDQELQLYKAYKRILPLVQEAIDGMDYQDALYLMEPIIDPINQFFEEVLVMVKDKEMRNNRLLLLRHIAALYHAFGDLESIVLEDREGGF